jgi:tRNA A-37 threonylcarbamoyl transferase component Bud32
MSERPPRGSGNGRLAAAVVAMAPALAATFAHAALVRRRFGDPDRVRAALEKLGLGDLLVDRTIDARVLGSGKSNAVVAVMLNATGDARGARGASRRLVLKRALPFGTLMSWGARRFGANYVYAARTRGADRIVREAAALRRLEKHGIAVPHVLGADPAAELIALDWIDGSPAATALYGPGGGELATQIGALLRRIHDLGVTLGDGHPGNMMIEHGTGRLVLFDLEFAQCDGSTPERRGFDRAYAAVLMPTIALRDAMLAGYGERTADERGGFDVAEQHLRRFGTLLDMELKRWAPR